ncbi:MAG TPA: hypothetical protein VHM31_06450 [Polyangia bacterium]|nr:hypothetical protein [Polyangia bacterium]
MKMKTLFVIVTLPLLSARRAPAQAVDAAPDAAADAATDGAPSDAGGAAGIGGDDASGIGGAAGGGRSGAGKDGGAHDAAPPPPAKFFYRDHPGCSIAASPDAPAGALLAAGGVALVLASRRKRGTLTRRL